jgi:hypothetical protein
MPYVGKSPDLNASVDTNELADDAVTLGKIGEDVKTAISGSFLAKADKSAISGSIVGGVSGSAASTGSFGSVHTAGNVGIGTSAPAAGLHVVGAATGQVRIRSGASQSDEDAISGIDDIEGLLICNQGGGATTFPFRVVTDIDGAADINSFSITSAGNVGIGTTAPAGKLNIEQPLNEDAIKVRNSHASWASEILDLTSASSPDDNTAVYIIAQDGTAERFRVYSDGDVQNHDGSYGATSDKRIKSFVTASRGYLSDLNKVQIKKFKMNDDIVQYGSGSSPYRLGVIGDELEQIFPSMVYSGSKASTMWSGSAETQELQRITTSTSEGEKAVKYSIFVPMLVKAVQELTSEVQSLRAAITGSTDLNQLKATVSGSTFPS